MSEYQYYDFRAIDRPLTSTQRGELGKISTRAEISSTRFTNFYTFGDFKGTPIALVERYFDAFLYLANWGTRFGCRSRGPRPHACSATTSPPASRPRRGFAFVALT
jgi:hypothetical protein